MSESQDTERSSKNAAAKHTTGKKRIKRKNRKEAGAKKTSCCTDSKQPSVRAIIAALVILCTILFAFNLVLVLKLVPNIKTADQTVVEPTEAESNAGKSNSTEKRGHTSSTASIARSATRVEEKNDRNEGAWDTQHYHVDMPSAGTLMFVFDDAGHNLEQLEYFLRLPFPCTIAVLPRLRYSSESAKRIRKAGKQLILHQPMQSVNPHIDPGPGAITPDLSGEAIKNIVRKNLEQIWPAAGMNNHEGSLITADETAMRAILDVAAEKKIFFLDSRTTAQSVVTKVAKERNMVVWERAIFIDNDKSRVAMERQIKKGLRIAKQKGSAIMIGHVFTVELAQLLTEMYPMMVEEGFSLSAIAEIAQKGNSE